jgi:hypothetical protein
MLILEHFDTLSVYKLPTRCKHVNSAGLLSIFCGYDWSPTFAAKLTHKDALGFLSILLRCDYEHPCKSFCFLSGKDWRRNPGILALPDNHARMLFDFPWAWFAETSLSKEAALKAGLCFYAAFSQSRC